jgi:muramoyltetrapeptide carboxypeptidase
MHRRTLLALAAALPACASVRSLPKIVQTAPQVLEDLPLLKPPRLRAGDVVAMLAPSGFLSEESITGGMANLTALGLKPRLMPNARARWGSNAGSPEERAADLQAAFADDEIRAIWPVRGGSGCARVLPFLDYARIRRSPKVVVGYSDITSLHLALMRRAGLVTFHGPVANSTFTDYTVSGLRRVLFEGNAQVSYPRSSAHDARVARESAFAVRSLNAAHTVAEGALVGGNLSVYASLLGTPFAPQVRDALLFLEDIGEAPYRVDRLLTQALQAAHATPISGVALGVFQRALPTDDEPALSLNEVLDSHFATSNIAAGYGFSFGHVTDQMTLPYGVRARMDTRSATLTLLEAGVS